LPDGESGIFFRAGLDTDESGPNTDLPVWQFVGWVERSATHQWLATGLMGFAALYYD
jgi:hypothetical protein